VTAAVATFIWKAKPEALDLAAPADATAGRGGLIGLAVCILLAAAVTGGVMSWFASGDPDGLEWSVANAAGKEELSARSDGVHETLHNVQQRTALLPDYDFPNKGDAQTAQTTATINAGTSASGLIGGAVTLLIAAAAGLLLRRKQQETAGSSS